jgi:DNA polymerase-3 subunit beta
MEASDYPLIELNKGEATIKLPSSVFRMIVNQTSFAASDKETRPILTGVNFRTEGDNLECVATDSFRLAKKVIKMPGVKPFNVTIPAKTLNEISRIIENEKEVDINISDKKVVFTLPKTLVVTRVISGSYPDTNKLIPQAFEYQLNTVSQSFISAIDRASLLSIDRQNIVKLSLSANKIHVTSKSQEIGSASENVVSFRYSGNPLEVSFTSSYVIDAIRALGTEEVTILFNGEMKPFIIKSKDDANTIQLVLPVRTY